MGCFTSSFLLLSFHFLFFGICFSRFLSSSFVCLFFPLWLVYLCWCSSLDPSILIFFWWVILLECLLLLCFTYLTIIVRVV